MVKFYYPETSGSTEQLAAMDRLSIGASVHEFKAPTTFPFQRLPMELQLLMLDHILVSSAPILNPNVPLSAQKYLVKGEEKGQHLINPRMIFTSKLFYKGLPLLYGRNTFMYTEFWTAFSYTLSKCDVNGCLRCAKRKYSPSTPMTEHPPGSPCNWNLAFQTHAANIRLRLPDTDESDFINDCEEMLRVVDHFTNLRILQLDFLDICTAYRYDMVENEDQDEQMMHDLQSTIWKTMKKFQDPNRSAGALKEIVFTGLPQNDLSLYVVKQYTRLLAPDGRIGVGWGAKGKRYELLGAYGDGAATKREDLELLWMRVEEVREWIVREHHTTGSRWLFTRQKPKCRAESSQSSPPPPPEPESEPAESKAWDQDYRGDLVTLAHLDDLVKHN